MKGSFSGTLVLVLGGFAWSLGLMGCGGGESHLSKAQFDSQANAVCARASAEQRELAGQHKKDELSEGNYAPVTEVVVPPMEKELRRLKALSPPQKAEAKVRALLRAVESGVKDAKFDYLDLFLKQTDPFAKANRLARGFGLEACAKSSYAVIKPQG